jgi:hypothetical protein
MNLFFPSGRLPSPRWRVVAWGSVAALLVYLALQALQPGPLGLLPGLDNPYALGASVWARLSPIYFAVMALLTLGGLASLFSLFLRLHRAQGDARQQIKWLVFPAIVFWFGQPFGSLVEYDPSGIFLLLAVVLTLLSVPGIVIAGAHAGLGEEET